MFTPNKINNYPILVILATFVLPFLFSTSLFANNFTYQFVPENLIRPNFMQLKKISSIGLSSEKINGLAVKELSGLAWDAGRKLLYAVSDAGILYHIKLITHKGIIKKTQVIHAYPLRNSRGKRLRGAYSDSEGLSLQYDSRHRVKALIISFEGKFRIARFSLTGKQLSTITIPSYLQSRKYYQGRNKGLESVTAHPKYGILTAPELPLTLSPKGYQSLYSATGKKWHFKRLTYKNSSITGLETLPNGDVLVLERAFSGFFSPMVISLRQLSLTSCNKSRKCTVKNIALFNSVKGWRIDNFEGLTHYQSNQYLMVSDDNNNPLQNSVLVLFELKK